MLPLRRANSNARVRAGYGRASPAPSARGLALVTRLALRPLHAAARRWPRNGLRLRSGPLSAGASAEPRGPEGKRGSWCGGFRGRHGEQARRGTSRCGRECGTRWRSGRPSGLRNGSRVRVIAFTGARDPDHAHSRRRTQCLRVCSGNAARALYARAGSRRGGFPRGNSMSFPPQRAQASCSARPRRATPKRLGPPTPEHPLESVSNPTVAKPCMLSGPVREPSYSNLPTP